jgi:hypothetical protein
MSTDTGSKKLLWHSGAPWAGTGYAVQTSLFAPRINAMDGWDVALSATWGLMGDTLEYAGMPVFPSDDRYGNATLRPLFDKLKRRPCHHAVGRVGVEAGSACRDQRGVHGCRSTMIRARRGLLTR